MEEQEHVKEFVLCCREEKLVRGQDGFYFVLDVPGDFLCDISGFDDCVCVSIK